MNPDIKLPMNVYVAKNGSIVALDKVLVISPVGDLREIKQISRFAFDSIKRRAFKVKMVEDIDLTLDEAEYEAFTTQYLTFMWSKQ